MRTGTKRSRTDGSAEGFGDHQQFLGHQVITRTKRHLPPAHYSLKVNSYSLLPKNDNYESGVFEAGGYKWRLIFYPNGDTENNGENYVSLYLEIAETEAFLVPWEVNVNFKLFVHDQLEDNYLVIQEANGGVKRFHHMKTTWGFARLLTHETLKDPSNGYIVDDSCVFGAEVFVIKHTGNGETLYLLKAPQISNASFTWEIEKFSDLDKAVHESKVFTVGGRNWKLQILPNGEGIYKGQYFGIFLVQSDCGNHNPKKAAVYATYKLKILDQVNGKHSQGEVTGHCFRITSSWGFPDFISLEDLRKPSGGFIVKDSLKVQVEFVVVSETKYFCESSS